MQLSQLLFLIQFLSKKLNKISDVIEDLLSLMIKMERTERNGRAKSSRN